MEEKPDDIILENALCVNQQLRFFNEKIGELCCRIRNIIREVLPCCQHISNTCHDDVFMKYNMQFEQLCGSIYSNPIDTYTKLIALLKDLKIYMLDSIVNLESYKCNYKELKIDYKTIHKYGDELN